MEPRSGSINHQRWLQLQSVMAPLPTQRRLTVHLRFPHTVMRRASSSWLRGLRLFTFNFTEAVCAPMWNVWPHISDIILRVSLVHI